MRQIFKPCLLVLLLSACSVPETSMTQSLASAEADVANGGRGLAQLNPQPRKAYEVTLTLKDAPGPFAVVEGAAQYDVGNEQECGRIVPATGRAGRITSMEDFALRKVSDTEYRGTVYLDLMQDQDYYGRGVCHWAFTGASVMLKATGAQGETRFLAYLGSDKLRGGQSATRYYWKEGYPREDISDFPDSGHDDPSQFKPEIRDALFSVTLTAREAGS